MKRFKKIYTEITNVCNLACSFCPKTMRAPEFMKLDTFSEILDQISGYTDYIYFHVKGEPLLHPDIDKFLDLSFEKGFKANITTNGTLISRAGDKLFDKPALRQVNFSLHSFDDNEGLCSMDEYIGNIFSFVRRAIASTGILISLRLWNLNESNQINIERERNCHILGMIEKEFNLQYRIEEKLIPERGIKLLDRVFLSQDYEFKWPDLNEEEGSINGFCYGLRSHAAILVDGTVVPCCLDGEGVINLGNIHNTSFIEIIEGERARCIFDGFSRRQSVEELCRKCGYIKRFNGQ